MCQQEFFEWCAFENEVIVEDLILVVEHLCLGYDPLQEDQPLFDEKLVLFQHRLCINDLL